MTRATLACLSLLVGCDPRTLGSFGDRTVSQEPAGSEDAGIKRDAGAELDASPDAAMTRDAASEPADAAAVDAAVDAGAEDAGAEDAGAPDAALPACTCQSPNPDHCATVYPGAPELCDGLDNDCNAQLDLHEGQLLGGAATELDVGRAPALVAAGDGFGVVYTRADGVWFHGLDAAGARRHAQPRRVDERTDTGVLGATDLAASDGVLGVAWARGDGVRFRPLDLDGAPLAAPDVITTSFAQPPRRVRVARMAGADWLVLFETGPKSVHATPSLVGQRITPAYEVVNEQLHLADGAVDSLALIAAPDFVRVGWVWDSEGFEGMPLPSTLLKVQYLTATLRRPGDPFHEPMVPAIGAPGTLAGITLASSPSGFAAVAWAERVDGVYYLRFMELDASGVVVCAPWSNHSTIGNAEIPIIPRAMIADKGRYLIVGSQGVGLPAEIAEVVVDLSAGFRICRHNQHAAFTSSAEETMGLAAATNGNILVAWEQKQESGELAVMKRVLAPTLCDPGSN